MNKHQVLDLITPGAAVVFMFVCGWLGKKGRWFWIGIVCVWWLAFAAWMIYGHS